MPFDCKDFISPVVAVTAVWLGAKLALSNEMRKIILTLETTRLERLALEGDCCLKNLHLYCMRVKNILEDLSEEYSKRITLADVTLCLKKSAETGTSVDNKALDQFQNTLELHRKADFQEWKELILPLMVHINVVLASPSLATDDCTVELSRLYWEPEQVKNYNKELAGLAGPLPSYRQRLFERIANDYKALIHPDSLNVWVLMRKVWHMIRDFVRYFPAETIKNSKH